jgi:AAA15 family ATPase/GTPase
MILEFGAKNFYSFKEGFEVSLRLSDACPKKISKGHLYSNVMAIKGANASGKTNVLKVLSFLNSFVTNSFNKKPDSKIELNSFFNNSKPTEFYIVFLENNIEYRYELKLTVDKVLSEILYRKDKRETKIIERKNNKIIPTLKEFKDLEIMKLRDNVSLFSSANQYDVESTTLIYMLFSKIGINVNYLGRKDNYLDYKSMTKYYFKNPSLFSFVKKVLILSDTGISTIKIEEQINIETGKEEYFPIFKYKVSSEKSDYLTFNHQSSGVKALYLQLGLYKLILDMGGTLVLDEFDINLHSDLLPMLIEFFDDKEKNPNNAQLIFTTHHTDIMDKLGKYRVVLVNKDENESFLYRLDEIQGDMLRNDRSIVQKYKEGKIGGKPRLNYG